MGKQISVAMTDKDEIYFLNYLRKIANIQLFEFCAPTKEQIWVENFSNRYEGHFSYYIWNKAFHYNIKYGQPINAKDINRRKWFYISNTHDAPLIQYIRHNFSEDNAAYGRIYWAKYFSATNGLDYDVELFDKWYKNISRWIRKNGTQFEKGNYNPYFLPDAHELKKSRLG